MGLTNVKSYLKGAGTFLKGTGTLIKEHPKETIFIGLATASTVALVNKISNRRKKKELEKQLGELLTVVVSISEEVENLKKEINKDK